jgi:hypothetical protein
MNTLKTLEHRRNYKNKHKINIDFLGGQPLFRKKNDGTKMYTMIRKIMMEQKCKQ